MRDCIDAAAAGLGGFFLGVFVLAFIMLIVRMCRVAPPPPPEGFAEFPEGFSDRRHA
jgi:hypothetical protein